MPTTLSFARFGIESSYNLNCGSVGTTGWHDIDPETSGLTVEQNSLQQAPRWDNREPRRPAAGAMTAGGTIGLNLHAEEGVSLLYLAFGDIDTTHISADGPTYEHCFTPGETQRSFFYEEWLHENACWRQYSGCTIDGITLTGDQGANLRVDYDVHGAMFKASAAKTATPSWNYDVDVFTGVIGSISKDGSTWTDTDNFVLNTTFGTAHARRWGYRGWNKACVGTVNTTLSMNMYFSTLTELEEFLGDSATGIEGACMELQDGLEVVDDFNITAETDQYVDAGTVSKYRVVLYIPRLTWETLGPSQELDDCIRVPMTGIAHYDPHDEYSIRACVRNSMTEAEVTDNVAAP